MSISHLDSTMVVSRSDFEKIRKDPDVISNHRKTKTSPEIDSAPLTPALFRRTGQTILTVVAPFTTIRFIPLFYAQ